MKFYYCKYVFAIECLKYSGIIFMDFTWVPSVNTSLLRTYYAIWSEWQKSCKVSKTVAFVKWEVWNRWSLKSLKIRCELQGKLYRTLAWCSFAKDWDYNHIELLEGWGNRNTSFKKYTENIKLSQAAIHF